MKIAILTDSTATIDKHDIKNYSNLYTIPLYITFQEDSYEDGSISNSEFFELVDKYYNRNKILPQTSQPNYGQLLEMLEGLLKEYDHVIYYTLSSKISGTYQSGVAASNEFENKVTVVDTTVTTDLQRMIVLKAVNDAKAGVDLVKIIAKSNELIRNSYAYFVVDDLSHLQRTGRISATSAVIGSMLKLKPILSLKDGIITPVDKIRNITKAHKQVCDLIIKDKLSSSDLVGVVNADAVDYVENIKKYLSSKLTDVKELNEIELSLVISCHTGPKTVGIYVIKDYYK